MQTVRVGDLGGSNSTTFFLMDIGGTDIILGMDWLASLGNVKANFKNLLLKWEHKGERRMIKGDPSLCKSQASRKAMIKALNDKGEGYMLSYQNFSPLETEKGTVIHSKLAAVLEEFEDLFTEPTNLPPKRSMIKLLFSKRGQISPI